MAKIVLWIITICGFLTLYSDYKADIHTSLWTKIVILSSLAVLAVVEAIEKGKEV